MEGIRNFSLGDPSSSLLTEEKEAPLDMVSIINLSNWSHPSQISL